MSTAAEERAAYGTTVARRIQAAMEPGREYSRADLIGMLDLTVGQWNAAIQELKRSEQVRQVGERRGAKYEKMGH